MIQNGFGKYNPADMKHRRASLNVRTEKPFSPSALLHLEHPRPKHVSCIPTSNPTK